MLPLRIRTVDGEVLDGPEAADRVAAAQHNGETVKTSPPTPADYLLAIEWAGADQALVVTPAADFTVMYRNARIAARHASIPVRVVDSHTAASGHGLVVAAALRAIAAGADLERVHDTAVDAAGRVELVASLDSSDTIGSSGIVPAPVLATPTAGQEALFRLDTGRVEPLGVVGDADHAIDALARRWHDRGGPRAGGTVVMHAGRRPDADRLAARLGADVDVVPFSPAMAVHTGSGVLGLAWLRP